MKISSSLIKAMLITATIGVTTAACTTTKNVNSDHAKSKIDRHHTVSDPGNCPACGMG
jgi:hypothetical protein